MSTRKLPSRRAAARSAVTSAPALAAPACQQCGLEIEQPVRGRPRSFCSSACRLRAFRARDGEPQITIPRALLDELAQVMAALGGRTLRPLSRALAQHDTLRARKLARAFRATHAKGLKRPVRAR